MTEMSDLIQKTPRISSVVANKIYRWGDHMPNLGLEQVQHLSIEEKRNYLFGKCAIDQFTPEHLDATLLFDTYIDIDLGVPAPEKMFFPAYLIAYAQKFQDRYGKKQQWTEQRAVSVACAMRLPRYARLISSCWLANHPEIESTYSQNWNAEERLPALYELFQIGGLKDWTDTWGPAVCMLPEQRIGTYDSEDLLENFLPLYDNLYSQAAACVVIGATFWEHACEIDEKYLFAVCSGCIPLVHGYRIYDRLQALGFDTFSDIIDTSSQYDQNPVSAIWNLWDRNLAFLKNASEIYLDAGIQSRLQRNFELIMTPAAIYKNAVLNLNNPRGVELFQQYRREIWQHFSNYRINFAAYDFTLT